MNEINNRQFHGRWRCEPGDWEEVDTIKINITREVISVTYCYQNGIEECEAYHYRVISDKNGIIYIENAPFSFLELAARDRIIISRLDDGKRSGYTYWFAAEMPQHNLVPKRMESQLLEFTHKFYRNEN